MTRRKFQYSYGIELFASAVILGEHPSDILWDRADRLRTTHMGSGLSPRQDYVEYLIDSAPFLWDRAICCGRIVWNISIKS